MYRIFKTGDFIIFFIAFKIALAGGNQLLGILGAFLQQMIDGNEGVGDES